MLWTSLGSSDRALGQRTTAALGSAPRYGQFAGPLGRPQQVHRSWLMVSLMIPLWQMAGNVTSLLYLSMRALSGDSRTNIWRAFLLTSSSVNSMILSLGRLWVDSGAVIVSGEMLRLDVFG
jgi:hypothetical protein